MKNKIRLCIYDAADIKGYFGKRYFKTKEDAIRFVERDIKKNPTYNYLPSAVNVEEYNYCMDLFKEKGWYKEG